MRRHLHPLLSNTFNVTPLDVFEVESLKTSGSS